jgi:hypothetical protein
MRELVTKLATNSDYQIQLANALEGLAELALGRKDYSKVRGLLEEAIPYNRTALQAQSANPFYRDCFRLTLQTLADVVLAQGEHAEAFKSAAQLAEAAVELAKDRYKAACVLAGCVPLAEKDGKLPAAGRQELAKEYADRAIAMLRRAIADGYKDASQMRKEPALDALRDRDDFTKLLADLEKAPAPPKQSPPAEETLQKRPASETAKDSKQTD